MKTTNKNLIFILIIFSLVFLSSNLFAQSITPFTIWKQVTQRGDITFTGNTMLVCNGNATCVTARAALSPTGNGAGGNYNNNNNTMLYSNIADGSDAVARFSRSNANLTLGSTGGCGVIYAELYWGGNITVATTNYSKRDSVYFKSPLGGYTGLKADISTNAAIPFGGYHCYKDVTSIVRQGGTGTYWLANQVLQNNGTNLAGGWMLVVIYNDPLLPLRNLTIFRGISAIGSGNPQDIPISGFFTPPTPAPINIRLGVYSLEGDRGTLGDSLKFKGNNAFGFLPVVDSKHTLDNDFNSTITNNTVEIIRNPGFPNTLGIDGNIFVPNNAAFNYLPNSVTSATLHMSSTGDVYAPFMISTAIDVFEPSIEIYKDAVDQNGGLVELGDTLKFTLKVVNKGNDPATSVILNDSLYGAMNYVPNSLKILTGANAGPISDAPGNDQGEFALIGGVNFVKFRLGAGANQTAGGSMGITAATDSVTTMEFKVTVTTDCQIFHCNSNIQNKAFVTYVGNISGQGRSTYSSPTGFDAFGCPALGPTILIVNVPLCIPPADSVIIGCSPYPLSNILPFRPGFTQYYNNTWNPVTDVITTGTYYAIKQLYSGCNDTIQLNMTINCVLPIILSEFFAIYQNNAVKLTWITQQEINNKEFIIERSVDGVHFEKIATVPGAINSQTAKTYSYIDVNFPHLPKVFYRLNQIDLDGSKQFTTIRSVNIKDYAAQPLIIYSIIPNPVKDVAVVSLLTAYEGDFNFTLFNYTGQKIKTVQMHLSKGQNTRHFDCFNIANGVYILEVKDIASPQKTLQKLIKK
jgi:uncharacterized repeat protein (TIGR01451 family)